MEKPEPEPRPEPTEPPELPELPEPHAIFVPEPADTHYTYGAVYNSELNCFAFTVIFF
jgi:hypothetical protein